MIENSLTIENNKKVFALPQEEPKVVTYSKPDGYEASELYSVKVQGIDSFTYIQGNINIHESPYIERVSFTSFSFAGGVVCVEINCNFEINSVNIRPASKGYTYENKGNTIILYVSKPDKLSIEVNGFSKPLFLWANPLEEDVPDRYAEDVLLLDPQMSGVKKIIEKTTKKIIYFTPGVYELGNECRISSNKTVYLEGGAVVRGTFCGGVKKPSGNITIRGRGIIDGINNKFDTIGKMWHMPIRFRDSSQTGNITIEGITLINGACHIIRIEGAGQCTIKNVKIIAWYPNTDAANVYADYTHIEDIFYLLSDDGIVVTPSPNKGCEGRAVVRNVVAWHVFNGAVFQLGWGNEKSLGEILYENFDVLHFGYSGWESIWSCHWAQNGMAKSMIFRNINIDIDFESGVLFSMFPNERGTCTDAARIRNMYIENVNIHGVCGGGTIKGFSDIYPIEGIHMKNFRINGNLVCKISDLKLSKASNCNLYFVTDISKLESIGNKTYADWTSVHRGQVDASEESIRYSGNWKCDKNRHSYNDYNGSLCYTHRRGDFLEYTFCGTGIDIIGPRDKNLNTQFDVYIDDKKQPKNAYANSDYEPSLYQWQQLIFRVNGLHNSMHTLKVANTWENRHCLALDYLMINDGKVYNNDVDLVYIGDSWNHCKITNTDGLEEFIPCATHNGDFVEYFFYGTGLDYISCKNSSMGEVDIIIDGEYKATISCYSNTYLKQQLVYKIRGLSNTGHNIRMIKANGIHFFMGMFEIYDNDSVKNNETSIIKYSGDGWVKSEEGYEGDFNDTGYSTDINGDYVELIFESDYIECITHVDNQGVQIGLYIDNEFQTDIKISGKEHGSQQKVGWSVPYGMHKLKLVKKSGGDMYVDGFNTCNVSETYYWAASENNTLNGTAKAEKTVTQGWCDQWNITGIGTGEHNYLTINCIYAPSDGEYLATLYYDIAVCRILFMKVNDGPDIKVHCPPSNTFLWGFGNYNCLKLILRLKEGFNSIKLFNNTDCAPDILAFALSMNDELIFKPEQGNLGCVPSRFLLQEWKFDEGRGDISYEGRGKVESYLRIHGCKWVQGKSGYALYYRGIAEDYAECNAIIWDILGNEFSLAAWIKADERRNEKRFIIDKGDIQLTNGSGAGQYSLYIDTDGMVKFYSNEIGEYSSNTIVDNDKWNHVVVTCESSVLKFYINNILVSTTEATGSIVMQAGLIRIGGAFKLKGYFSGIIDQVRIYGTALSEVEVTYLFNESECLTAAITNQEAQACMNHTKLINFGGGKDNYLEYENLIVNESGTYKLSVYFMIEGVSTIFVSMNDDPKVVMVCEGNSLKYPVRKTVSVTLKNGANKIRLYSDCRNAPQIDRITISKL